MDPGEEIAGGLVVAGCDGAELLEFREEVLDQVACLVEIPVVVSVGADQVVRLAAVQEEVNRVAERVDQVWILVLSPPRERPIAWSSPAFWAPALC